MPPRLVVPTSQRDAFYWQLHVLLDQVDTTARFVDELLSQIGLQGADRLRIADAMRARLPADVDELDVAVVAAALEENGVLSWTNDLRSVPRPVLDALETAVTAVLRSAPPGAMPRLVADALIAETSRVLGDLIDEPTARVIHDELLPTLEHDLWRRDTEGERLVNSICSAIAKLARIAAA